MYRKLTVVIPLFNKKEYIKNCLDSIFNQVNTIFDLEVVIIDDGSSDGSDELVRKYNDERIVLVTQENAGVSAARNHGIKIATGDYVCFLDADDLWLPGHLLELSNLLEQFPGFYWYSTNYQYVFPDGRIKNEKIYFDNKANLGVIEDFFAKWSSSLFLHTNTVCFLTSFLNKNNIRFREGESWGEDHDFWYSAAMLTPVVYSNKVTIKYFCDVGGSLTQTHKNGLRGLSLVPCDFRLKQMLDSGIVPLKHQRGVKQLLATKYLNCAVNCIALNNMSAAADAIFQPIVLYRFSYAVKVLWKYCSARIKLTK